MMRYFSMVRQITDLFEETMHNSNNPSFIFESFIEIEDQIVIPHEDIIKSLDRF